MRLLLFDIDGTLLTAGGAGRQAIERGLADLTGVPITTSGISFSGKTDQQILREVLDRSGADADWMNGRFPEVVSAFRSAVQRAFDPAAVRALPGAVPLVEELGADGSVQLGLLTGNLRESAYLKVGAIGLGGYFPFGAFGCDHADRNRLPAVAQERAEGHTGRRFDGRDLVVIGDTPRDVACCRAAGGVAVAVATGRFSRDELAAHAPDVLLDSLEDAAAFVDAVLR
ncbi:MAG: HAD hydrolase-like protein [Rhodothermales bacterium]|nr:HAD hydrolase-like protein [Rhodothermales bacterium]